MEITPPVQKNPDAINKAINKEDKNSYSLLFPIWLSRFIPSLFLTPEGIIIIMGKNHRIVYDPSTKLFFDSLTVNMMMDVEKSPPIVYGFAFLRHLEEIWNIRISYPTLNILLWDDDFTGAFRTPKYNPKIITALAYVLHQYLMIPAGGHFGCNNSAQEWEPIARARMALATFLDKRDGLVTKHADIIKHITFVLSPTPQFTYCTAKSDSSHKGVLDSSNVQKRLVIIHLWTITIWPF